MDGIMNSIRCITLHKSRMGKKGSSRSELKKAGAKRALKKRRKAHLKRDKQDKGGESDEVEKSDEDDYKVKVSIVM